MNREATLSQLQALIIQQHPSATGLCSPEAGLADLGLDSLAVAELLFSIEDAFAVSLGDMDMQAVPATVGEVVDLIHQRKIIHGTHPRSQNP